MNPQNSLTVDLHCDEGGNHFNFANVNGSKQDEQSSMKGGKGKDKYTCEIMDEIKEEKEIVSISCRKNTRGADLYQTGCLDTEPELKCRITMKKDEFAYVFGKELVNFNDIAKNEEWTDLLDLYYVDCKVKVLLDEVFISILHCKDYKEHGKFVDQITKMVTQIPRCSKLACQEILPKKSGDYKDDNKLVCSRCYFKSVGEHINVERGSMRQLTSKQGIKSSKIAVLTDWDKIEHPNSSKFYDNGVKMSKEVRSFASNLKKSIIFDKYVSNLGTQLAESTDEEEDADKDKDKEKAQKNGQAENEKDESDKDKDIDMN